MNITNRRLNQALREQIIQNALDKAGITEAQKQWDADYRVWAERVRVTTNGISDVKIAELEAKVASILREIPTQTRRCDSIALVYRRAYDLVNVGGLRVRVEYWDESGNPEYRPCPADDATIPADHPLTKQFHAMNAQKDEIEERRSTLRAQVKAVVDSIKSYRELLNVWPEAVELLPTEETIPVVGLPALNVADLNAAIGLNK